MIQSVSIQNFKCIGEQEFPMKNLTLLTGKNNSGKSVLTETLLLLRNSSFQLKEYTRLMLKKDSDGSIEDMGTYKNIFNHYSDKSEGIKFSIMEENNTTVYETLPCNDTDIGIPCTISSKYWDKSVLFDFYLPYISSARIVPVSNYPTSDTQSLNKKGLYTANYICANSNKSISISLQHHNANTDSLIENINCWLSDMFDENIEVITTINVYTIELRYKINSIVMLPQNVSVGITSVLPILVTLLSAKPNSLVIIDKPELNLYGSSISVLTKLMCLTAQSRVQVICETNSDHIVNGVLVTCKEFSQGHKGIDRNNISVLYMEKDHDNPGNSKVIPVPIKEGSRITYAPKEFFSQYKSDQKTLMGF